MIIYDNTLAEINASMNEIRASQRKELEKINLIIPLLARILDRCEHIENTAIHDIEHAERQIKHHEQSIKNMPALIKIQENFLNESIKEIVKLEKELITPEGYIDREQWEKIRAVATKQREREIQYRSVWENNLDFYKKDFEDSSQKIKDFKQEIEDCNNKISMAVEFRWQYEQELAAALDKKTQLEDEERELAIARELAAALDKKRKHELAIAKELAAALDKKHKHELAIAKELAAALDKKHKHELAIAIDRLKIEFNRRHKPPNKDSYSSNYYFNNTMAGRLKKLIESNSISEIDKHYNKLKIKNDEREKIFELLKIQQIENYRRQGGFTEERLESIKNQSLRESIHWSDSLKSLKIFIL